MTRAERRDRDIRKALRKKRISDEWFKNDWMLTNHYYDNLHQYSKNKIHCSCPICSVKTKHKLRGPKKWYSKHDQLQFDRLAFELQELKSG